MHQTCQLLVVEGRRDDGAGVHAIDDHAGPLPGICQKLRYTQPHAAPRRNPRQHLLPARLCGDARCCLAS
jgi:hypothetical protein